MSDIEPSPVSLEDGEIEGDDYDPCLRKSSTSDRIQKKSLLGVSDEMTSDKMAILDKGESKKKRKSRRESLASTPQRTSKNIEFLDLVDEDEMLCVRGASPVPFVVDVFNTRNYTSHDSDSYTIENTPPKKSKMSNKLRRKKRNTSKQEKEKNISSDDQHDGKASESIQPTKQQKPYQLCKFYLEGCCAKGRCCEYMHSEFPCKFFYMGLKCEDEVNSGCCKLSHGGTLSQEMLVALIRHIHRAPNNVLGEKFVQVRSNLSVGKAMEMLYAMQEKLALENKADTRASKSDLKFVATLREKLDFLTEEQIDNLEILGISRVDDLFHLTLAQLSAIGIRANQLEAIQMSSQPRQDMDMRNNFPPTIGVGAQSLELALPAEDPDTEEALLNNGEDNADNRWYEEEEKQLIIDESEYGDDKEGSEEKYISAEHDITNDSLPCTNHQTDLQSEVVANNKEPKATIEDVWEEEEDGYASPKNCFLKNNFNSPPKESGVDTKNVTPSSIDDSEPTYQRAVSLYERRTSETNDSSIICSLRQNQRHIDLQMLGNISPNDWDAEERLATNNSSHHVDGIDEQRYEPEDVLTTAINDMVLPEIVFPILNLDNYKPALEIDAHFTLPAMKYKVREIYIPDCEVNKPPPTKKFLQPNSTDPRVRKFMDKEKNGGNFTQTDYSFFPPTIAQCDPRLRPGYGNTCADLYYNSSPILYGYLQRSLWYQKLNSSLKMRINHIVSDLVRALNAFHKDSTPNNVFDLFKIESAGLLLEVMKNVGIMIDASGKIIEESNYEQLCGPQQTSEACGSGSCSGSPLKPGLLGYAPPGIPYSHPHTQPSNEEISFARQAFGYVYGNNKNNEIQPPRSGFYVGERRSNRIDPGPSPNRRAPKGDFKQWF